MSDTKEIKIEIRFTDTAIQFRPLGIGHSQKVWKIITGRGKPPFDFSACCSTETASAEFRRIASELIKNDYTPLFVPLDLRT